MKFYFTVDGTYGIAEEDDMVVLDTSQWSDDDWQIVENCSDSERFSLAKGINK